MTPEADIDPQRWAQMDPLVRSRFHDLANHITRLEGMIAGLTMRVPERPEVVPVLAEKVSSLESGHRDTKAQIDRVEAKLSDKIDGVDARIGEVDSKIDSLTLRIVGGTTALTALGTVIVNAVMR